MVHLILLYYMSFIFSSENLSATLRIYCATDKVTENRKYCFTGLVTRSLRSRYWQGHASSDTCRTGAFPCFFQLLAGPGAPWLVQRNSYVFLPGHMVFSPVSS